MSDVGYRTIPYKFEAGRGVVARDVYDVLRPGSYRNVANLESRQEGSLSSRYGLAAFSTDGNNNFPLGNPVVSLGRMQSLTGPVNYAHAGNNLYRKSTDSLGQYQPPISTALSFGRISMAPYRPNGSSNPYMFFADQSVLLKDSGVVCNGWGISPPTEPALIAPFAANLFGIELFDEANLGSFSLSNISSSALLTRVACLVSGPVTPGISGQFPNHQSTFGAATVTRSGGVTTVPMTAHGYGTGMRLSVKPQVAADASFAAASAVITVIDANNWSYPNPGPNATSAAGITASPMPSFQVGMSVNITDANPETVFITEVFPNNQFESLPGFVGNFTRSHNSNFPLSSTYFSGTIAANTLASVSKPASLSLSFPGTQVSPQNNLVQFYVLVSNPLAISEIKLQFDVGDGSFNQDFYSKSIVASPAQSVASGTVPASVAQTGAVFGRAGGAIDVRTTGSDNASLLPSDLPILQQMQAAQLDPAGANVWTLIQVRLADFVPNGAAGGPVNNWNNVVAWRIQFQTQATLSTNIGVDDLVFIGGSDLDSFAGQAYDYRYTYYNVNTGLESGPSQIMVATDPTSFSLWPSASIPVPLAVQRNAIQVTPLPPTDPQVTHVRIYRRGGTLTQAWYFVTQIPIGTLTFIDTIADSTILVNNTLVVDADAPVTSLLPTPLHSTVSTTGIASLGTGLITLQLASGTVYPGQLVTIDSGTLAETCYVQSVSGSTITVYLQLFHGNAPATVAISASTRPRMPMNLMAIAFDKAWLAGDPNNPHILYYSTTFSPETFPAENFLEIGTPDAPIMALIEMQGLLFVFTTKRVYEILGAGSAVPNVIPTGVKHGLSAQFAWCVAEGIIYYLSYDGIYAFRGGQSSYMSEPTEWIWTGKNLGPIQAINTTLKGQILLAYYNHEIFCRYIDQNGVSHRVISHETYGYRWRNDDQSTGNITAMYFSEDTGALYVGKDDGMVYQDRVNDWDSGGFVAGVEIKNPINVTLQTGQMDHSEVDPTYAKRTKVYNEVTIDATLNGATATVSAIFDSGNTVVSLGTITGTIRQQFQLKLNAGQGIRSLNVGLLLTASVTAVMTVHETQIRLVPEAEYRRSWDTYWLGQGAAEWKMTKQIWAEYYAPDPAGVSVNAFTEGNMTAPAFTFTLPTTGTNPRASKKIRFPATKYRLIRYVGVSSSDFSIYDETEVETKALGSAKGYQRSRISP